MDLDIYDYPIGIEMMMTSKMFGTNSNLLSTTMFPRGLKLMAISSEFVQLSLLKVG
ncbi:hypothetical protein [Methanobrevibacter sp.]|uniref:hypothetical protein n=1 Tax=Methanobrevibacter sp. TaxID=66852 RepID=UPI002E78996D|nr:hypothetical protein [Methanobrevibacter sp.]MEE0938899.1 hypothetical protein [Methanobrevibacter sp.]